MSAETRGHTGQGDCGRYCLGGSIPIQDSTTAIIAALAAAGLLLSDVDRAVQR